MSFIPYQKKVFLVPESMLSMAAIHTKIKVDGECQIRIADCNQTVKLWNNLNNPEECKEMLQKITTLEEQLKEFKHELVSRVHLHNLENKSDYKIEDHE